MASFDVIEVLHEFILRGVKTRGLRPNTFNGKKAPGHQISVAVQEDDIKKIQNIWDSLKPKKPTPFFGFNATKNMITVTELVTH